MEATGRDYDDPQLLHLRPPIDAPTNEDFHTRQPGTLLSQEHTYDAVFPWAAPRSQSIARGKRGYESISLMGSRIVSARGAGLLAWLTTLALCVSGCAMASSPAASQPATPVTALGATASAPEWRPRGRGGDGLMSGADTETQTLEDGETREGSKAPCK